MESIYASRTVQRFGKWVLSLIGVALAAAVGTLGRVGCGWAESRASRTAVASEIAKHASELGEIKRQAYHGASLSDDNAAQTERLWEWEIAVQAELMVYRNYGRADAARRGELIEHAKRFYQREWDTQRKLHANDLAKAARITMLAEWRPDR